MNAACQLCGGACCESLVVTPPPTEEGRWLGYHGATIEGGGIEIESPCNQLCAGRCGIHAHRPRPCVDYAVGSLACRATVLRRRPSGLARAILALTPPPSA